MRRCLFLLLALLEVLTVPGMQVVGPVPPDPWPETIFPVFGQPRVVDDRFEVEMVLNGFDDLRGLQVHGSARVYWWNDWSEDAYVVSRFETAKRTGREVLSVSCVWEGRRLGVVVQRGASEDGRVRFKDFGDFEFVVSCGDKPAVGLNRPAGVVALRECVPPPAWPEVLEVKWEQAVARPLMDGRWWQVGVRLSRADAAGWCGPSGFWMFQPVWRGARGVEWEKPATGVYVPVRNWVRTGGGWVEGLVECGRVWEIRLERWLPRPGEAFPIPVGRWSEPLNLTCPTGRL